MSRPVYAATIIRRYSKVCIALTELRAKRDAKTAEHQHMRGLPNEIAAVGGESDAYDDAVFMLERALEVRRVRKRIRPTKARS